MPGEDVTSQLMQRLDALAEKVGTTASEVWPVLIQEQVLRGQILLILGGVMLLIGLAIILVGLVRDNYGSVEKLFFGGVVTFFSLIPFGCGLSIMNSPTLSLIESLK